MSLGKAIGGSRLVLALAAVALAQKPAIQPAKQPDEALWPPPPIVYASRQSLGNGVTLARLSSGLTVIVQENHSAPVATVRCYVQNTGSAYEGKDLGAGLSHVLEHLVAGGTTTKRTETQIREILDSLGGHTNAYTSDEITCFLIDCPASGVATAIELLAENMQFSLLPEAEYVREMGVVQRELEMGEADRSRVLYHTMKQLVYLEHPARHPTIGYLAVVQQIKRDDVIAFYKNRYVPQNMSVVVAGDVDTDKVLDSVLANFKQFQRTTERFAVLPEEPGQAAPRSARLEMDGQTTHYAVAWPTVALQHPDLYPLDVASHILTNGDSSRLMKRLRIAAPLATSVTSASYTPGFVRGWFEIAAECDPQNLDAVRQIIAEEIERLRKEPVGEAELAKAKRQKAAEHVFQQQRVESQAEMLSASYRATGDPLFDTRYVDGIQQVTPDQIMAVAKKYFSPERQNTVLIEPLGSAAAKDGSQAADDAESPIAKTVLPNGLTVLLKRQAALPLVTMQVYARAGVVADTPETSGLASLTTEMLEKGTKAFSAEQIANYFDSIGGTLALNSQTNTSYLQSAVLKDDAAKSLDYIYQVICQPTFPAAEFATVQKLRLSRIAARQANPQTEIMDFFARQLPPTSPYGRTALGDPAVIRKLTPDDCRKFHQTWFVPANLVLSVFGDIDPPAILRQIEQTFGKVPRADKFSLPKFPNDQAPLSAEVVKHLQNQKKVAMVLIAFPTVSVHDERARATLDVLDAVVTGGGGAGGRLHEELRGQQLVYYIFGIQMSGFAPGYFVFLAQTQPDRVPEVVERIRANLDKIRREGVPADEFEKAKEKLVVSHDLKNVTPAERAFQASIDELYGLGFNYDKSYADRISRVQPADVQAIVQKFFTHAITVTSSASVAPDLKK
ncbi:MAG: M16 family metallopeptidase [Planctomycetaceae bacterium]